MKKNKLISLAVAITVGLSATGYILLAKQIINNQAMKNNSKSASTDSKIESTINALPIPKLLEDKNSDPNIADFTLEPQDGITSFIPNTRTQTMGYNGSFLGPVIRVNKGEQVNIHVNNKLKESTTVHWHGLEVEGNKDGGPHQGIEPGKTLDSSFIINQPAATLWYHPHYSGSTASQVYKGLAGLFYVEDELSKSLNIPKEYGINDIPLVIQDRSFSNDGSFIYNTNMMDGATGDTIIVNGAIKPNLDVKKVKMRFRIVNGANTSNFKLKLDNRDSFYLIASDGGFLQAPVNERSIILSPGERAEIIIDFSKYEIGTKLSLMSENSNIMTVSVKEDGLDTTEIPSTLSNIDNLTEAQAAKTRSFDLQGMGEMVSINGQKFDMNRIDVNVKLGDTEVWEITNSSSMMHGMGHPFHIHGTQFQVLSRNGNPPSAEEQGLKDTIYIEPNEKVKILVKFNKKGIYMYHCHILEHEEAGMMGQVKVE